MAKVTFINPLTVPEHRDAEFLAKWDVGAAYMKGQKGCVSTSLHKSLNPAAQFRFFTVAVWESAEDFVAAISTQWWQEYVADFGFSSSPDGFVAHPTLCEPVRDSDARFRDDPI